MTLETRQGIDYCDFFNEKIRSILNDDNNQLISFIDEIKDDKKLKDAFKNWPKEIKRLIVEDYIINNNSLLK